VHGSERRLSIRVQDAVLDGTALAVEVVVGLYLLLLCVQLQQPVLDVFQLHADGDISKPMFLSCTQTVT
jgi:hypothetical protein